MAKILLVEDDEDIADNMVLFLEHNGHHVVQVASGADGLEQMRYGNFDVVLLDGHLPDMDGLEVCRTYRQEGGRTPILMATGRSKSDDLQRGADAGVSAYIVKPFTLSELAAQVNALLQSVPT